MFRKIKDFLRKMFRKNRQFAKLIPDELFEVYSMQEPRMKIWVQNVYIEEKKN